MAKFLKFGGPELNEGQRTWYEATDKARENCAACWATGKTREGTPCQRCGGAGSRSLKGAILPAAFGACVPIDNVAFADYYVSSGRGEIVSEDAAKAAASPPPVAEVEPEKAATKGA